MNVSTEMNDAISPLRKKAYTGSNRCWPCTVLNLVVLLVLAAGATFLLAPTVGLVAVVVGLVTIWLRGYLVPYTPQLTPQLLRLLPIDHPQGAVPTGGTGDAVDASELTANPDEVLDELLNQKVLVETGDRLTLHTDFSDAWRSEMGRVQQNAPEELAEAVRNTIPWVEQVSVVSDDERYWVVLADDGDSVADETWLAPSAAIADLAAVRTLASTTDMSLRTRAFAAASIRQFLEQCPVCEEQLELMSPHTCCGSPRSVAEGIESILGCQSCDEVIATIETSD